MQTLSKSNVRRCLFGPPDHESIRKDLDKALEEANSVSNTEMKTKWNYDLEKDVPLEGKFKWEVIDSESYVPEFYKRGYPVKVKRRISDINVKQTSGKISSLTFDSCDSESCRNLNSENSESSSQSSQASKQCNIKPEKLVQTQISAFMPKRKRSSSDVSSVRSKAPRL